MKSLKYFFYFNFIQFLVLFQGLVNQIFINTFKGQDYLMSVDMNAKIMIFKVENMDNPLYEFESQFILFPIYKFNY